MGWGELRGWLREMHRQKMPDAPDPHRWTEASKRNFDELAKKRDEMRAR